MAERAATKESGPREIAITPRHAVYVLVVSPGDREGEETSMEVTVYEDPACWWCWAFQPVFTVFAYEFRNLVRIRHAMGGLRDRPGADADFFAEQCRKVGEVFEMPFDCGVWKKRPLRSTFPACRAVKAASLIDSQSGVRLLRRLGEAFHAEQVLIDELETILHLASEAGVDIELLSDNLANGRADALFERDREEASRFGFGFPTLVIRSARSESPRILEGAVPYEDILGALAACGVNIRERQRFEDTPAGWQRLFCIHRRLTLPEIRRVASGLDPEEVDERLRRIGARRLGHFFEAPEGLRLDGPRSRAANHPLAGSPVPSGPIPGGESWPA
jgi:putative protein-disulfide isomerase